MKIMFLDESGDHSLDVSKIDKSYPMFVLAGCIFDFDYYVKIVEPAINHLKEEYFGKTDIILRSYDIRKQKGDFSSLVDFEKRSAFYEDIGKVLDNLDFTIIAAVINKFELVQRYIDPENPYSLCFRFILERAVIYLGQSLENMILRAESRESHNDKQLAAVYENFRKNEIANFKLVDLSFNQKGQNIAGHQIADLAAYPIGRWALDSAKENKPFQIIEPKFHKKDGVYLNYGLKVFLRD